MSRLHKTVDAVRVPRQTHFGCTIWTKQHQRCECSGGVLEEERFLQYYNVLDTYPHICLESVSKRKNVSPSVNGRTATKVPFW
jgi:hypothetical protein